MEEYKISVIVPVYKVEKYLNKCVDSIINQTHKNLEIILIDDGSPDNCGKICNEYAKKDSRIKVIHKENGGVSSARNVGLDVATGDYIGFVDSDDWIEPDMYEFLLENIIKYNVDISQCGYYKDNEDMSKKSINIISNDEILKSLFKGIYNYQVIWTKLCKKNIFDNLRFREDFKCAEDKLFNYYILKEVKNIVFCDYCKYHYIRRENSALSGKLELWHIKNNIIASDIIIENEKNNISIMPYVICERVLTSFFLINSIIRNNIYYDEYKKLRKDILKYKKTIFFDKYNLYRKKHKIGTFLLWLFPMIYKFTIIGRKFYRGY